MPAWNKRTPTEQHRVPPYDQELNAAADALRQWRKLAAQLHDALGCRRQERRRIAAETAFAKLLREYRSSNALAKERREGGLA